MGDSRVKAPRAKGKLKRQAAGGISPRQYAAILLALYGDSIAGPRRKKLEQRAAKMTEAEKEKVESMTADYRRKGIL